MSHQKIKFEATEKSKIGENPVACAITTTTTPTPTTRQRNTPQHCFSLFHATTNINHSLFAHHVKTIQTSVLCHGHHVLSNEHHPLTIRLLCTRNIRVQMPMEKERKKKEPQLVSMAANDGTLASNNAPHPRIFGHNVCAVVVEYLQLVPSVEKNKFFCFCFLGWVSYRQMRLALGKAGCQARLLVCCYTSSR
jgi:hypothetical protein